MKSNIQGELEWMHDVRNIDAILLFGSRIDGTATTESDYDICVVAPSLHSASEKAKLLGIIWRRVNARKFDVWIFEELPLYLQIGIIQNHEVLFCDDLSELYEYFYHYRKQWRIQAHRQSLNYEVSPR